MELARIISQADPIEQGMAEQISAYALNLHIFEPCYWCGSDTTNLMAPIAFMEGACLLYCTLCGRHSRNQIDGRVIPFMVTAWLNEKHVWHGAVMRLLMAVDAKLPKFSSFDLASSYLWISTTGQMKGLRMTFSQFRGARADEWVYDWTFFMALRLAINQAAAARLSYSPLFDLSSNGACMSCGANPSRHVMRNFNEVLREGEIYCGGCGKYIRSWDPN